MYPFPPRFLYVVISHKSDDHSILPMFMWLFTQVIRWTQMMQTKQKQYFCLYVTYWLLYRSFGEIKCIHVAPFEMLIPSFLILYLLTFKRFWSNNCSRWRLPTSWIRRNWSTISRSSRNEMKRILSPNHNRREKLPGKAIFFLLIAKNWYWKLKSFKVCLITDFRIGRQPLV